MVNIDREGLSEYTVKELKAELKLRAEQIPEEEPEKEWFNVEKMVHEMMSELQKGQYVDEDTQHYIFEEVLNTMYGRDIWDWYNKRCY